MSETDGWLAPEEPEEARTLYESVGPSAQVVTREVAKAMGFDREEYRERVTGEVVETARDALFASLLEVHDGSREDFEGWREGFSGEVSVMGSENVDRVVWHAFDGEGVAATYQNEPEAARGTLRRQAFGRLYRPLFDGDGR
ncbi:DUF5809 family protein [Halalkalicoccus jeotgali]|uniref:Uncharacterized protein n=1 Tax=Halalkalicoccus jeotgali (strain DSM 18796 / CECT 7217 / JCM 14584 / KCTC 4019 / B3) TaxID=795797 RepID=D8J7L5_HALJB|nr:DUF5809 family protein [Halalkalicoccus jeotgali]ADJ16035.1 hypothetical protein HacjB3_13270 [Halalkalicoccus jeotgali B3]ELY38131.1 hypothetical protein C497_08474 [Halalkalicoccus jeotgali B3]